MDLGICDSFYIPKLHFAKHYLESIKLFGTTDNYNTEYMERLHIDLVKHVYAATNFKDEFTQMTIWLERKEKVHCHEQYIQWRQDGSLPLIAQKPWSAPSLELDRALSIAKHLTHILQLWIALNQTTVCNISRLHCTVTMAPMQLEHALWDI